MAGILEKRMKERSKALAPVEKKSRISSLVELNLPRYGEDGDVKRAGLRAPKTLLIVFIVVIALVATVYVPSFFAKPNSDMRGQSDTSVNMFHKLESDEFEQYVQANPDADFDEDGLSNAIEIRNGTDPRNIDTDGDGCSDYAELNVLGSDPLVPGNELSDHVKNETAIAGRSVDSPYKVNDIVMWPKDWNSRAKGSVVKTLRGYRFCDFKGWAQFPIEYVAYKVKNDVHTKLSYRSEEKAFYIDDDCEVILYPEELEPAYRFTWFGTESAKPNSFIYKVLNFLLPNNSPFIACRKVAAIDNNKQAATVTKTEIENYGSINLPESRLGRNTNRLSDLASVYVSIKNGKCVLMSVYDKNRGEAIFEVYGFNHEGALLVADPSNGEPVGSIQIEERVSRVMVGENSIRTIEWFKISGCGIDSSDHVKLSFFTGK